MKDETLAIHHGYSTDPTTHAVATPIYQTVAYEFDNAQHGADLFGSRMGTRQPRSGYSFNRRPSPATASARKECSSGRGTAMLPD